MSRAREAPRICASSTVQEKIMFTPIAAKRAAVRPAASGFIRGHFAKVSAIATAILLMTISLGGCLRADPPLVGGDPADPGARVAATSYRSTTAPYTRMRPTVPTGWGGNAPAAAPDR
jgi:hypothetical protein